MNEFEKMLEAIAEYVEAKRSHDKACDEYNGWSWGYHGYQWIEDVRESTKRAEQAFQTAVRSSLVAAPAERDKT